MGRGLPFQFIFGDVIYGANNLEAAKGLIDDMLALRPADDPSK